MPHIILEYSSGLGPGFDAAALLQNLHEAVGATEGFELDRIKSRAVALQTHIVGRSPGELVHATVAFSPGRTPRLREELGQRLLAILTARTRREGEGPRVHRSVEIRQFEEGMYFTSKSER